MITSEESNGCPTLFISIITLSV